MAAPRRRPVKGPIDPRGPRFGAAVTCGVLALALVFGPGSPISGALLAIQLIAFAFGAVIGLQQHPYGWIYKRWVKPRLGPPAELEDPAPPQFAQAVGLIFALVDAVGWLLNAPIVFYAALGLAFAAAFLNAVFGLCIGCELYLMIARSRPQAFTNVTDPNANQTNQPVQPPQPVAPYQPAPTDQQTQPNVASADPASNRK